MMDFNLQSISQQVSEILDKLSQFSVNLATLGINSLPAPLQFLNDFIPDVSELFDFKDITNDYLGVQKRAGFPDFSGLKDQILSEATQNLNLYDTELFSISGEAGLIPNDTVGIRLNLVAGISQVQIP